MTNHLKHCGPIRSARAAKRTALVEIQGDESASNAPSFDDEAQRVAVDLAYAADKDSGALERSRDAKAEAVERQYRDAMEWRAR